MSRGVLYLGLGALACIGVAWALVTFVLDRAGPGTVARPGSVVVGEADIGGPFRLVDQDGRTVSDADFRGRFMLIFFGFTYCPDICPMELVTIAEALDRLGPEGERVVPIFVSVDPERDTPDVMGDYVRAFHPRLIGLTGTTEQVAEAARAYRVAYRRAPGSPPGSMDYLVDHSAFTYLMGPDGGFRALFRFGTDAETMARELASLIGAEPG